MLRRAFDWCFRDRGSGRVVIAQWPNAALWLYGLTAIVARAASGSPLGRWAETASRLALVWWAADELLRGVNPWRRALGAAVLVVVIVQLVS